MPKKNENQLYLKRRTCPLLTACGGAHHSRDDQNTETARSPDRQAMSGEAFPHPGMPRCQHTGARSPLEQHLRSRKLNSEWEH